MKNSRLVYSTESGKIKADAKKKNPQPPPSSSGAIVRLMRQTKGRKGKGVTLISGLPLSGDKLKALTKSLKQKCGSGGAIKNGLVEIQGEHRELLQKELTGLGYTVKLSGG